MTHPEKGSVIIVYNLFAIAIVNAWRLSKAIVIANAWLFEFIDCAKML